MADREILKRIDAQLERGNDLMAEVREEHLLNRTSFESQLELTRTVIQRNGEAFQGMTAALDRLGDRIDSFGERIESLGDRIESFGERVDAFGATLELQREVLLRFLDRLDDGDPPQG